MASGKEKIYVNKTSFLPLEASRLRLFDDFFQLVRILGIHFTPFKSLFDITSSVEPLRPAEAEVSSASDLIRTYTLE